MSSAASPSSPSASSPTTSTTPSAPSPAPPPSPPDTPPIGGGRTTEPGRRAVTSGQSATPLGMRPKPASGGHQHPEVGLDLRAGLGAERLTPQPAAPEEAEGRGAHDLELRGGSR